MLGLTTSSSPLAAAKGCDASSRQHHLGKKTLMWGRMVCVASTCCLSLQLWVGVLERINCSSQETSLNSLFSWGGVSLEPIHGDAGREQLALHEVWEMPGWEAPELSSVVGATLFFSKN